MSDPHERVAVLLAPGPSLKDFNTRRLRDLIGFADFDVIAVNSAMHCREVPVNIISFHDRATIWLDGARARWPTKDGRPLVWCRKMYEPPWIEAAFPTSPHPDDEYGFQDSIGLENTPELRFVTLTITQTLGRIAGAGYRLVVLAGVDMFGTTYSYGEDIHRRSAHEWKERWEKERESVAKIKAHLTVAKGMRFVHA